jgi:uncharacterized protein DUF1861
LVVRKIYDVHELLARFRSRTPLGSGKLVTLEGLDGHDGYNPSAPIRVGTSTYVLVRLEPRNVDFASWSVPFRQVSPDLWEVATDLPMLRLEDPFVNVIHGELVVGGVRIVGRLGQTCTWETVFFRGRSLMDLEEFARSPLAMKDVRLVELDNGRVGVFTRPWGDAEYSRPIGYTELNSLDELDRAAMAHAPLLPTQPIDGQWWGANAVYPLPNGDLGVLAHMATVRGHHRHYYAVAFVFDRLRREIVDGPNIVAERACFPAYDARAAHLHDVIFPAWIDRDRGLFYGGLSDAAIGVLPIEDPFADQEPIEESQIA